MIATPPPSNKVLPSDGGVGKIERIMVCDYLYFRE
jgi:hypothetical protein